MSAVYMFANETGNFDFSRQRGTFRHFGSEQLFFAMVNLLLSHPAWPNWGETLLGVGWVWAPHQGERVDD